MNDTECYRKQATGCYRKQALTPSLKTKGMFHLRREKVVQVKETGQDSSQERTERVNGGQGRKGLLVSESRPIGDEKLPQGFKQADDMVSTVLPWKKERSEDRPHWEAWGRGGGHGKWGGVPKEEGGSANCSGSELGSEPGLSNHWREDPELLVLT